MSEDIEIVTITTENVSVLEAVAEDVFDAEIDPDLLNTEPENEPARRLYEGMGEVELSVIYEFQT